MRKLFGLIILIIILVSLTWFHQSKAQDVSQLTSGEKADLLRAYQARLSQSGVAKAHNSRNTFDTTITPRTPQASNLSTAMDSTEETRLTRDSIAAPNDSKLPEFSELRPFGLGLFNGPRESAPPDDIASSGDYILGPGDNIVITLWGRVEQEYDLTVDREGKVFVPKVGEMAAWGKRLDDFKKYAKTRLATVFSDFDMSVSLGKIRSIRIYLTGEVRLPGAYTVSSLTSLFNALYLAGGPTENGSMRNIRLMRNGKAVAILDAYKFLLEGDNTSDIRLETGDAIFVPVAGARVAIRGQIRRPAIYELKGTETALDLLGLAGNPTPQAHLDRVFLERISSKGEWEVQDLNLNSATPEKITKTIVRDGDRLTVYSIFDAKRNMVAISGMVKHPGYYERTDSTRIKDLLTQGQLQDYDVYVSRADLFRRYSDNRVEVVPISVTAVMNGDSTTNIRLRDRDSLHVYSIQDVERDKMVYVGGEVQNPGSYPLYDHMTVADLVFLAGSFTRGASRLQGELAHTDSLGQVAIDYVNLNDSAQYRTPLREDDRLYIRTIPEWQLHRTVKVEGEVQFAGEYVLSDRTETLFHLLQRCGGFTSNAFPPGAIFERKSISRRLARLQIGKILENSRPLIEDSTGELDQQMVMTYDSSMVNRIVIDLQKIMASNGGEGDITLQPGDRILIPQVPSGISVMGAVGATGTIKYIPNQKVKYYVERAGNFTPRADKKGTRLIKANGAVFSGKEVLGRRAEIGDVVVVPSKIEREKDWLKAASTALAATTSILTTVLLIDKL